MSSVVKRCLQVLLAALIILVTMELLLQLGSLIVQAGARDMPRDWLTNDTRILAVGDSNTFGIYLEAEEAYPAQLEALWNETHPEHSIEVRNVGYPGMNSFRILDNIDDLMTKFRPDVVLLTVGVVDRFSPVEEIEPEADSLFGRVARVIRRYSRLYHLVYMVRKSRNEPAEVDIEHRKIQWDDDRQTRMKQVFEFKAANRGTEGDEVMRVDGEEFVVIKQGAAARSDASLEGNLARIVEIVRGHGAEVYVLTYGASKTFYKRANHATRRYIADNKGVNFIDTAKALEQYCPDSEACPELFFEDLHPNAEGYRIIAGLIMERLAGDWSISR